MERLMTALQQKTPFNAFVRLNSRLLGPGHLILGDDLAYLTFVE